jgi:hypothetical protein
MEKYAWKAQLWPHKETLEYNQDRHFGMLVRKREILHLYHAIPPIKYELGMNVYSWELPDCSGGTTLRKVYAKLDEGLIPLYEYHNLTKRRYNSLPGHPVEQVF